MKLKMPERAPSDGPIGVNRPAEGMIGITASTNGETQGIQMSEYNAWRVFGCLAMMLGIPLSKNVGKAIKLGNELNAKLEPSRPLKTLGDRVAHNLHMKMLEEELKKKYGDKVSLEPVLEDKKKDE